MQDDHFETDWVTVCPFTNDLADAPLPDSLSTDFAGNGLAGESRLMVDKITTVRRSKLGARLEDLSYSEIG